jgi:hypothetical protein
MRASSGALTLSVGLGFGYDVCSVAPSSRPWFWIAYVPSIARTSENDRSGGLQVSECPAGTSIQIPRFDNDAVPFVALATQRRNVEQEAYEL